MLQRRLWRFIPSLCALLLVGLACGGSAALSHGITADSDANYRALRGGITIDGSSTVFPISQAAAEEFSKVAHRVRVKVGFSGTGGGIEKFCRGDIDIADASRAINQKEKDACAKEGITDITELQVGLDALTVVVHPENTWATCLTMKELNLIFRQGGAKRWNDVRPEWPDHVINFFHPGPDSGTFSYFVEEAITKIDKASSHRSDGTASEDDNVIARGIEGERYGVGYFGFAVYQEAGKRLRAVEIDSGKGCVGPSIETALSGAYKPLSRPLYVYSRASDISEHGELESFLAFYLRNSAALVREVGYIPLPEPLRQKQLETLTVAVPE